MKLTYLLWGYPHDIEIIKAFEAIGVLIDSVEFVQGEVASALKEKIQTSAGDIVFSVNFFAEVSNICQQEGIPYCSWILQLPNFDLYTVSVKNPCNYLGVCDSYLVEKLWQMGIAKAFFLPDAVDGEGNLENDPVYREPCFLARHPKEDLNTEGMTLYGKGYLDAFLHAQRVLYGASILETGLINRVQEEFLLSNPIPEKILPEMQQLFMADNYLAPVCTALQQNIFLQNFESIMTIYSDDDFSHCKSAKYSYVEEETQRKKIYEEKEFTLVLAPHTLHNGIPRQTLEVIMAGGFPISGFQKDYAYFFQKDENLVYFRNPEEFKQILVRYGNSHEERERVRRAAYEAVLSGHTYSQRVMTMLEMWGKL